MDYWKDNEKEIWKPIEGFEGKYEISNLGRVYSIPRNGTYGCIMRPYTDKDGYLNVSLACGVGKQRKSKKFRVHRLVAMAFIPNDDPMGKPLVNHLDFNRQNNCVDNLEWCDYSKNRTYQKQ